LFDYIRLFTLHHLTNYTDYKTLFCLLMMS